MGIKGDISSCTKIPPETKLKIKKAFDKKKIVSDAFFSEMCIYKEDAAVQEISNVWEGKRLAISSTIGAAKGPLDVLTFGYC